MIGILINGDTRPGVSDSETFVGRYGSGSLQGARSYDFLIEGVEAWSRFFRGVDHEITVVVDEVEPLPTEILTQIPAHRVLVKHFRKDIARFNDHLYLDSLEEMKGYEYIVHADFDAVGFRSKDSTIVDQYLHWLDSGQCKFICQPTPLPYEEHQMDHASTRFFICRSGWLDLPELRRLLDDQYKAQKYSEHLPCLEHIIGAEAGRGSIYYPPLDLNDYVIFSWVKYHSGLLHGLNQLDYPDIKEYVERCGLHGAQDLIAKPLL